MAKRKKKSEPLRLCFVQTQPGIWTTDLDERYKVIVKNNEQRGWVAKIVNSNKRVVKIGKRSLIAIGAARISTIKELFSFPQVWDDKNGHWFTPDEFFSVPVYKFYSDNRTPLPNQGTMTLTISYDIAARQDALREQKLQELDAARKLNQQIQEEFQEFKAQLRKKQGKSQANFSEKPFAGLCQHNLPLEECPRCASWGSNYEVREHD